MRTCRLEGLNQGEIGLIDADTRSLCFRLSPTGPDAPTIILSNSSLRPAGRTDVFSLMLSADETRHWPTALAFNDAELSPDFSSLAQDFELPERALVPSTDGVLRVAVRANGWSIRLLNCMTGDLDDHDQRGSAWYFSRWTVTVPSAVIVGQRQPIFSVEIA